MFGKRKKWFEIVSIDGAIVIIIYHLAQRNVKNQVKNADVRMQSLSKPMWYFLKMMDRL